MILLRIVCIVPVLTLLLLSLATVARGALAFESTVDLPFTYTYGEGCGESWHPWIEAALQAWASWVPELNFTEVPSEGKLVLRCYASMVLPASIAEGAVGATFGDTIWISLTGQPGTTAHELGHVFGLEDRTDCVYKNDGDLMCPLTLLSPSGILSPTQGEIEQVRSHLGLPVPEFSVGLSPALSFLIALFAFWTPVMRRRKVGE